MFPLLFRELEQQLAAIWREALDLEALGVDDNFFDLGGDSLAAVRVISRVQRELNAPVGLAALFDAPTVADLAALLRGQLHSGAADPCRAPDAPEPQAPKGL